MASHAVLNNFPLVLTDLPEKSSIVRPNSPNSPPGIRRDSALDGLRGLAILLAFVHHYGADLQPTNAVESLVVYFTQFSWCGIVLFFALSGFLITGSLWENNRTPAGLANFYIRRSLRVLPLYLVALLTVAIAALVTGARLNQLRPLLLFVVFLQNFPHLAEYALTTPSPLALSHFWTIAVEVQFYVLWPLVIFYAHSRRHAIRLSLWFFALSEFFVVCLYTLPPFQDLVSPHLYDGFLLTNSGAIALGCVLSLAMGNRASPSGRKPGTHRLVRKYAQPSFVSGLCLYLFTSWITGSPSLNSPVQFWLGLPALSITAAAAIPLVLRTGLPRAIFSWTPLGRLGRISYGFYVFHILLEPLYNRLGASIAHANTGDYYQIVRALFAFLITYLVSFLSFHFFEMPILSLKRFFPVNASLPWGEPITETLPIRHTHHRSF